MIKHKPRTKHLVPLVSITAAKSKQFHLTDVFVDHMHLLYLGVTSAGTDDLGMSSSVSVPLLNKVFAKDTPACLHKDFSLQSCLDLVFLILILLP